MSHSSRSSSPRRLLSFAAELDYAKWPAAAVVASLRRSGYDAVEWTMAHAQELQGPAVALGCPDDLVTDGQAALEGVLRVIDLAAGAGIGTVNVKTGPALWNDHAHPRDDEAAWATALRGLEAACRRGEELGVAIGLEACWGNLAHDGETTQRVLDSIPISLCFDPSHFVLEREDIPALVRAWGERIVHVHLKDGFGAPGREDVDFHFPLLGDGLVPWPALLAALDDVGYRGPLSVQFEAVRYYEQVLGSDPEAAARLGRQQLAALLAERAADTVPTS